MNTLGHKCLGWSASINIFSMTLFVTPYKLRLTFDFRTVLAPSGILSMRLKTFLTVFASCGHDTITIAAAAEMPAAHFCCESLIQTILKVLDWIKFWTTAP